MSDSAALLDAAKKAFKTPFGAALALETAEGPAVFIDGRDPSPAASDKGARKADCTLRGPERVLLRALASERALEKAFLSGQFAISGDLSVMARARIGETA